MAYCYKIFKTLNCLLQQHIYYSIKFVIKNFGVYCNEIFCFTNLLSQILLQQLVSTIVMTQMLLQRFFCCYKHFFLSCFNKTIHLESQKTQESLKVLKNHVPVALVFVSCWTFVGSLGCIAK